ncbi:thiamine phosphate synthase [Paenibacillus aestuarii]|uniref:Thiamine-phosphate synthase n=1 Tax=Paenibacillus aestuarii TaxID=516965 RepID=A0ABW0K1L6_9BACL
MTREALREHMQLYFIMGSVNCKEDPVEVLRKAIAGGITCFQYREKGKGSLQGHARYELAQKLRQLCMDAGIPFIVNDDINLAIEVQADGIHVGQEDEPAFRVRERIGSSMILGVSAYNLEEAERAAQEGADYLGIGPIYPTGTKEDAKSASGTGVIRLIHQAGYGLPMVGIGGIHLSNAWEIIQAGADGVSVISAISHSADPQAAASALYTAVQESCAAQNALSDKRGV